MISKLAVSRSRPSVPYGAIICFTALVVDSKCDHLTVYAYCVHIFCFTALVVNFRRDHLTVHAYWSIVDFFLAHLVDVQNYVETVLPNYGYLYC